MRMREFLLAIAFLAPALAGAAILPPRAARYVEFYVSGFSSS